jgi:hypothetical protein
VKSKLGLIVSILLIVATVLGFAVACDKGATPEKEATPEIASRGVAVDKETVGWLIAKMVTVQNGGMEVAGPATFNGAVQFNGIVAGGVITNDINGGALYLDDAGTATIQGIAGNIDITPATTSTVDIVGGGFTVAGATTLTGLATLTGGATTPAAIASTMVNAASGSANPIDWTGTLGIMNGSDNVTIIDLNPTNANHTGAANYVYGIDIGALVADADALEAAIKIGVTWDYGLLLEGNNIAFDLGRTARIAGAAGNLDITVPATSTVDIVGGGFTVAGATTLTGNATLGTGSSIYPSAAMTATTTSVVFSCFGTVAYTDTANKTICKIPANANIVDITTIVTTLFNSDGTDLVACGTTWADPDEFVDDLAGQTVGVLRMGSGATMPYAAAGDIGASTQSVWCKYTNGGTAATTGLMTLVVNYVVD